jgi:hypothetical protein
MLILVTELVTIGPTNSDESLVKTCDENLDGTLVEVYW